MSAPGTQEDARPHYGVSIGEHRAVRARSRILRTINHRYLADYLHIHTQGTGETLLIWPQSGELTSMQLAPLPPFSENFLDPSRPKQDVSQDLSDLAAVAGTLCPTCLLPSSSKACWG